MNVRKQQRRVAVRKHDHLGADAAVRAKWRPRPNLTAIFLTRAGIITIQIKANSGRSVHRITLFELPAYLNIPKLKCMKPVI
jgi:hypothetical protein